ncbi:MAG: hypothetical protein AB8F65_00530 [Woeseiaceae bacterium]
MSGIDKERWKRMGIALLGYLITATLLSMLSEYYPKPTGSLIAFTSAAEGESAMRIIMIWMNTILAINAFLAFAVAGYLLRSRVLVPGVGFFIVMVIPLVRILYKVAQPADPSITMFEVFTGNIWGWLSSLAACVIGLLVGQWCYQWRQKRRDSQAPPRSEMTV